MPTSAIPVQVINPNLRIWDIVFDAATDVLLVLPHGMGAAPACWFLTSLLPEGYVNQIRISGVDGVNINIAGTNIANSDNIAPQARLVLMMPHTVMQ